MKLSSQTIVLSVALALAAAATTTVNASSRNLIRNRKTTRERRNLIKVESVATTLEEIVQIDDAELVRALMDGDTMSMSMPSNPSSGGDSEDSGGKGGDSGDGGGSNSSGSGSNSEDGDGDSDSGSGGTDDSSGGGGEDGTPAETPSADMSPAASPSTAVGEPTESGIPGSAPLDAPSAGETGEGTDAPSSASRQNVAMAAIITIAFMVVPFIL
jgi:hypothetical protein